MANFSYMSFPLSRLYPRSMCVSSEPWPLGTLSQEAPRGDQARSPRRVPLRGKGSNVRTIGTAVIARSKRFRIPSTVLALFLKMRTNDSFAASIWSSYRRDGNTIDGNESFLFFNRNRWPARRTSYTHARPENPTLIRTVVVESPNSKSNLHVRAYIGETDKLLNVNTAALFF